MGLWRTDILRNNAGGEFLFLLCSFFGSDASREIGNGSSFAL
jgi:hypothetical protein